MTAADAASLTPSLEDYLETIYDLSRDRRVARVRDVAAARDVKASSVTPAMKRLSELGLLRYERREYLELTAEGEQAARRVQARHRILTSFFGEVLGLPAEAAERDACAMEHHLSDEAMSRLVQLFEFMRACPREQPGFLEQYRRFPGSAAGERPCTRERPLPPPAGPAPVTLASLRPGQTGKVKQVNAAGAIRQRLLDMGILPDERVQVERLAPAGGPLWIRLGGYQLTLRRQEAEAILVEPIG